MAAGAVAGAAAAVRVERPGVSLAVERRGEGPPTLLIQGVGVAGRAWAPQVEALSLRRTCAHFDNRGIGASTPLRGAISVPAMVDDALAVLDALGWSTAAVVGHSLGGVVAWRLALAHPERVSALGLLCTFHDARVAMRPTWSMAVAGVRGMIGTRQMRRRAFAELVASPADLATLGADRVADALSEAFGRDVGDPPRVQLAQARALAAVPADPTLASLRVPTLVLSGAHDRIAPPGQGRALAAAIPGARYVELEAGHAAPVLQAEQVNAALAALL